MSHQPAIQTSESPVRRSAFALIEMLGVLAVLAILALALAPVLIRRMDIAAVNSETATLTTISNALVVQVLHNTSIPSEDTWFEAVGNCVALPSASITTNARRHARAFLVDPSGWLGTNLPSTGYYSQTNGGTPNINSAYLMIVSSLSADLPISSGRSADFANIWTNSINTIPSSFGTWGGRADDLLIQRINLRPLFSQLILVNRDTNDAAAYSIAGQTYPVTGGSISNAYYFNGSVVGLGSTNSGSTIFQTSHVLNGNISFVFEGGTWGGQLGNSPALMPTNVISTTNEPQFKTAQLAFLAAPNSPFNSDPNMAAGDQEQVLAAMINFMSVYALWSGESLNRFTDHGVNNNTKHLSIWYYLNVEAQTNLIRAAGTGRNIPPLSPPYWSGLLYLY